ncbi:calcium-binding tyrosine phosphorylation-regulated protein [Harpia harpyja]|uniref:calcium-binding tyrosine phosphorylation-regulated protein n=1 Tax=Harpia harpyja TaxID=202280 RepID=UPI0022B0AE17|nr:calcium-binding tyrosine phosphorylation-regulated protein [Harpia harpyja]
MAWQGMSSCHRAVGVRHFALGRGRRSAEGFCLYRWETISQLEWVKMQSSKIRLIVPRGLKTLLEGVSRAVIENNPDDIAEFFALYFQELVTFRKGLFLPVLPLKNHPNLDLTELVEQFEFISENGNKGLEEKTSEYTDTLFSGEPKQKDKCTDTEEDQLLEEPDIQYSSKVTQHPSIASSIAESKSSPGSDGASSPEGPELVYIPAEPAQLAAHVLGNTDSFYSVRDVATSVQTLHEDSQTSEDECTPVEGAAEDASAVPAADASVEAVRPQPGAWSQSSIAGELGPSDSQADVSTNDVNQASLVSLWEDPSSLPLSLPPSRTPKDPLQAVPSCNEAEVTSTTEVVSLCWDDELIMDTEVLPYVEQFPQKIIIPFVDQTAYLLKIEQPLNVGQGLSAMTSGSSADDLVCHPERTESTVEVESAEQVYVVSAMASSEAGQPPPHSNVWTLYCLTDLRQGQKSPPSLPPAGAGVPYSQATPSLSRGKGQQCGQLSKLSAPIYVMQEESKTGNAPPFILVGSNVQDTQDWTPIPSHAVFAQQDAGAKRFTTVPVPVARPADEERDLASPNSNSAEETEAKLHTAHVFSVAIPLDDVMSAKKGPPAGDKHTG